MIPFWLLSLFVAAFVIGTDDMVIAGLLPALAADLDITEAAAGQLVTVFSLTYAFGVPVLAVATARLPRRTVLLGGVAAFTVVNVAAAAAPTFSTLFLLRILAALAAATVTSVSYTVVTDLAPVTRRGRYLAVITAGLTVSLIVGVPLGTWVGATFDWRMTFLVVAAMSAVALVCIAISVPRLSPLPYLGLRERLAPLQDRTVGRTLAALVITGAGGMMTYVYLAPVAHRIADVDSGRLAMVIGVFGVAGVVGTAFGGTVADALPPRRAIPLVFGGTTIAAGGMAALASSSPFRYAVLLAGVAVYGVFVWSVNPPVQVRLAALAPSNPGPLLGLNISALYAGFTLAGAIGGGALHLFGVPGLLATSCGLLALGTVLLVGTLRKEPQCASASSHAGRG